MAVEAALEEVLIRLRGAELRQPPILQFFSRRASGGLVCCLSKKRSRAITSRHSRSAAIRSDRSECCAAAD
jgi:hypothetical protein